MNTYDHVACDFMDADACRITCVQRMNRDTGKAVACLNYVKDAKGLRLERLDAIAGIDKSEFKSAANALMENSIPADFKTIA